MNHALPRLTWTFRIGRSIQRFLRHAFAEPPMRILDPLDERAFDPGRHRP